MERPSSNLSRWTTDALLAEVCRRGAGDKLALRRCQGAIIHALLAECDRDSPRPPAESVERFGEGWARRDAQASRAFQQSSPANSPGHCARPPPAAIIAGVRAVGLSGG